MSDRDNTSAVLRDLKEHRHSKVKVRTRWVTPTTIIAGLSKVRRAEISGGYKDGWVSWVAPSWIICALNLEASPAAQPIVE
jgi:hypothetical protein